MARLHYLSEEHLRRHLVHLERSIHYRKPCFAMTGAVFD